ncbi:GFA family protein [Verticiella sediminum]|uniref:GFA family protein n=1 Tax=Verticiella sediminum TaxID=1247510 RepID=A0A556AIR1_9BURK|nr:GFA family protein [Verticiella sediminum]TSH92755.1 GFA family protein [Verticiella sediminum]
MKVTGGCHCGHVSYEAELDPENVSICHCTDCQMLSGSAYRVSVRVPVATFRLNSGSVKVYLKTAQSGAQRTHSFCPECGSPVHSADPNEPKTYSLRVGCLDQRARLAPRRQIWCRSAVPWSGNIESVPGVPTQ